MRVALLGHGTELLGPARWAFRFARSLEAELRLYWTADDPGGLLEADRAPDESIPRELVAILDDLRAPSGDELDRPGGHDDEDGHRQLPHPPVSARIVGPGPRIPELIELLREDDVDLVAVVHSEERSPGPTLARKLFTASPWTTMILRVGASDGVPCRRIAVASAGGPSARAALRLGEKLAAAERVPIDVLHVLSGSTDDPEGLGERRLREIVREANRQDSPWIHPRAVQGDDLASGIAAALEEEHDVLLLGASHVGSLRRLVFGTVPDRFLRSTEGVAIGVVREEWSTADRWRARAGRWLDLRVPQLDRENRAALYDRLESGAVWSFDFMALMTLATAIAALGLLQNSGAVVIGAMLVAPLMTPILAIGLALLQGNLPLLRHALRAVVQGYVLALLIGVAAGLVFPIPRLTAELLARGGPTLLDMGVAFLSGAAAAYCLGRPGLLAALPGVAIAAALVPPIATTGIVTALGRLDVAAGSSLLFGTNVVAIVVGAAAALWAAGIRGNRERRVRWPGLAFLGLAVTLAWFSVPLLQSSKSALADGGGVGRELETRWQQELEADGRRLLSTECSGLGTRRRCRVLVAAEVPLPPEEAHALVARWQREVPGHPRIRLVTELSVGTPDGDGS